MTSLDRNATKARLLTGISWAGAGAVVTFTAVPSLLQFVGRGMMMRGFPTVWVMLIDYALPVLAVVTLAILLSNDPRRVLRGLLRLKGALLLLAVALLVDIIIAANMGWPALGYLQATWYALVPLASCILGFAASRRTAYPLFVVVAAAWIAVAGGLLGYLAHQSAHSSLAQWYEHVMSAVAYWRPEAGESWRAVGFDVDPNYYGLLGVVVLAFVIGLESHRPQRAAAAVAASLVVVLSGSRMAAVSVILVLVAWAAVSRVDRSTSRARLRDAAPVLVSIGVVLVLAAAVFAVSSGSTFTGERVAASVQAAESTADASARLDVLSGTRLAKWKAALGLYSQHPAGAFVLPGSVLGYSTHNDYLNVLIRGGPVYLAVYLVFLLWLVMLRPIGARTGGITLAVAVASAAAVLTVMELRVVMAMTFYLIGWLAARSVRPSPQKLAR